jgi:hypothetical protein
MKAETGLQINFACSEKEKKSFTKEPMAQGLM